jgi:hypothetical protein
VITIFGTHNDIPVVGDWDGDGTVTIGIYRPADATFYLRNSNSSGNPDLVVAFGSKNDIPLTGDWNGNGRTTVGVYRPSDSTFYLRKSNTRGQADLIVAFGSKGDIADSGLKLATYSSAKLATFRVTPDGGQHHRNRWPTCPGIRMTFLLLVTGTEEAATRSAFTGQAIPHFIYAIPINRDLPT